MPIKIIEPISVRTQRQLIAMVLDKSPSMNEQTLGGISKIQALANVSRDLITRLQNSRIKANFDISIISFSENATIELQPTPLTNLTESSLFRTTTHGGGTNLTEALEKVQEIWNQYKSTESELNASCVTLLVTDGEPNIRESELQDIANNLKSQGIIIACCLLPSIDQRGDQAKNLMKQLVTNETYFTEARDVEQIRNFFIKSISSATGTNL